MVTQRYHDFLNDHPLMLFLNRKGAMEEFKTELAKSRWTTPRGDYYEDSGLSAAFPWDETPQGRDYWDALSEEYSAEYDVLSSQPNSAKWFLEEEL